MKASPTALTFLTAAPVLGSSFLNARFTFSNASRKPSTRAQRRLLGDRRSHIYMQEVTPESVIQALDVDVPTPKEAVSVAEQLGASGSENVQGEQSEGVQGEQSEGSDVKASAGAATLGEGGALASDEKAAQDGIDKEVVVEVPEVKDAKSEREGEIEDVIDEEERPRFRKTRKRRLQRRTVTYPFSSLEVNKQYTGTVMKVMEYGAFVNIGAEKDGLLHVSRMSNSYVRDAAELFKSGDTIEVVVTKKDEEKNTFSLATVAYMESRGEREERASVAREASAEKWATFKFNRQEFIKGTVKHITDFGIFVGIDGPADGLVHLSEIPRGQSKDSFSVGNEIEVRIVTSDPKRKRIGLSMKNYEPDRATISEQLKAAAADQPIFKTTFQLAWEKANALKAEQEKTTEEAETR